MNRNNLNVIVAFVITFLLSITNALALGVNITKDIPYVEVNHNGKKVIIQRIQDQSHKLTGGFTKTSRKCPPFCIQPITPSAGVKTVGELEIFKFMGTHLKNGTGVLIDARTPEWHKKGTIPGSINIPFTTFGHSEYHPKLRAAMKKLGVKPKGESGSSMWSTMMAALGLGDKNESPWDYSDAKHLLLWCNGMWCGQSPRAIRGLVKLKYPLEKIRYYRGGMQTWQILGLTVVVPES